MRETLAGAGGDTVESGARLEGWKSIAAFVGRDERTAKRWELTRSLPVRRLPGENRSMVFAYAHELARWRDSTREPDADWADSPAAGTPAPSAPAPEPPAPAADPVPPARAPRRAALAGVALATVLILAAIAWWQHRPVTARPAAGTRDPIAAAAYRRGRLDWSLRTRDSLTAAIGSFRTAVRRDPGYAEAYAGLAQSYELIREFGTMAEADAFSRAEIAARRAVALNPRLAEAHAALGFALFWWDWDRAGGAREFRAAIALDPGNATAHHWWATALHAERRFDEALVEIRRSEELDPSCAATVADEGAILLAAGREKEAAALAQHLALVDPDLVSAHGLLAQLAWRRGDDRTYLDESAQAARLRGDGDGVQAVTEQRAAWRTGGRPALIAAQLAAAQSLRAQGRGTAFGLARALALAGRADAALSMLEASLRAHEPALAALEVEPAFASLQNQARYAALRAALRNEP